jgi:hypothetical protein
MAPPKRFSPGVTHAPRVQQTGARSHPEIIQNSGKSCAVETMTATEYRQALLEKLVEEAQEALQAAPDELVI